MITPDDIPPGRPGSPAPPPPPLREQGPVNAEEPHAEAHEPSSSAPLDAAAEKAEDDKRARRGCLFGVGLVVLVFAVAIGSLFVGNDDDGPDDVSDYELQDQCEKWVDKQLKTPSTAKHSDQSVRSSGVDAWTVTGAVDAQNSFGATIRSTWSCDIRLDGDTWRGNATLVN